VVSRLALRRAAKQPPSGRCGVSGGSAMSGLRCINLGTSRESMKMKKIGECYKKDKFEYGKKEKKQQPSYHLYGTLP
jgi:hypothetical protein